MKNSFFSLPDFGGELLDIRLAIRLIVRQAFKPVMGSDGHVIPATRQVAPNTATRPTVAPVQKTSFILSLKQSLWSRIQTISQSIFPLAKPMVKAVAAKPFQGKTATGKSANRKSLAVKPMKRDGAQVTRNGSQASGKGMTNSGVKPIGKSVNKNAAKNGKRIAANARRVASNGKKITSGPHTEDGNPRIIQPANVQAKAGALRDGMWVEYNKHAVVIARGNYTNNLKTGVWREYYDTGELMIEEHFLLGVQHGRFATFHPNGQCCSDGMYKEGRREGQFFLYDETGRHMRSLTFKRDVLIDDVMIEEQLAMA